MRRTKWVSLFLALVMCMAVLTISASASTPNDDEGIAPHYEACEVCGGVMKMTVVWNETWVTDPKNYECIHNYPYGYDTIKRQYGTQTNVCTVCNQGGSGQISRSERVCHGSLRP